MTTTSPQPSAVLTLLKNFDGKHKQIDPSTRGMALVEAYVLLNANHKTPEEIATSLGLKPTYVATILETYTQVGIARATLEGRYYVPDEAREDLIGRVKALISSHKP